VSSIWRAVLVGTAVVAALAGTALLVTQNAPPPASTAPAPADEGPAYKQVAKFRVEYQDRRLGPVTGDAYCKWAPPDWGPGRDVFDSGVRYGSGIYGNSTEKRPHCQVKLYEPSTGKVSFLTAVGEDIREPVKPSDHLLVTLHGQSPAAPAQKPMAGETLVAPAGGTAEITLKNGETETKFTAPIMQRAAVDDATVTLDFTVDTAGSLLGSWNYYADMSSERNAQGSGRVGTIVPQKDEDGRSGSPLARTGGFKALQRGGEMWRPLEPRIYAVHVMEDQAGFDNGVPKYSLNRLKDSASLNRTLVIFGRDLPVLDGEDFAGIRSKAPDGLAYTVIADSNDKKISEQNKQRIAQALVEERARLLLEDAAHLGSMDAVVIAVEQKVLKEPGPRTLDWGGAQWQWNLQYGDNTASARFVRIIRRNDHVSAPGSGEGTTKAQVDRFNSLDLRKREQMTADEALSALGFERTQVLDQSEQVTDLAMPDRVVVEVQVGAPIPRTTIPVVLGGEALAGKTVTFVATKLPDRPNLYRTDPLIFTASGGLAPASDGPGTVIPVTKGARILAKIDEGKTYFLRRGTATAYATPQSDIWLKALAKAASCRGLTLYPSEWPKLASQTAETISKWQDVDITFGDHAAMLILRDALLQAMHRNLAELNAIAAEPISDKPTDQLIDGWYRSVHNLIALAPNSPLATFPVHGASGGGMSTGLGAIASAAAPGTVQFAQAYSKDFEQKTFATDTSPDGVAKFRAWRRKVSHEALAFYRDTVADAVEKDAGMDVCDRQGLLALAGSIDAAAPRTGGAHPPGLITSVAPLFMKSRAANAVSEPDFIARAYVDTIDQLVARLQTVQDYSSKLNKTIVAFATVAIAIPAAFTLGSITVVEYASAALGESLAVGVSVSVAGLINFSYNAGNEIYDTYKSHADVAFSYAHYQTLGIDRYLDAQSLDKPWWKTIRSVFTEAVLDFGKAGKAEIREEGALLQRGARVAETMTKIDSPLVTTLAAEDRAALALYMAKEQEFIAARGVVTRAGKTSEDILERLAARAANNAAEALSAESMAIRQKMEAAALAEVAVPVAAGKAPLAVVEQKAASAGLVGDAQLAQVEDETKRAADLANAPPSASANEIPRVDGTPFIGEKRAYVVPGRNTFTAPGRPTVTAEIEGYVGAGEFSQVYKLKKVPDGLPVSLKPSLHGKKLVIKYIKKPGADKFTIPQYDEESGAEIASQQLEQLRSDTPLRLRHAEEVLGAAGQQAIPHAEFQVFAQDGFVIQELLEKKEGELEFLAELTKQADFLTSKFDDRRKAVAELVKKLIDARVEMHDFNPGNIYVQRQGGKWVAKILDADFINRFGETRSPGAQEFYMYTLNTSISTSPFPTTPLAAQMNIMERKGWLKYNGATRLDQAGFLNPEDFRGVVEWPGLQPPPPPRPPAPQPLLDLKNLDLQQLARDAPGSLPRPLNPK
jgi:hypothetical protein